MRVAIDNRPRGFNLSGCTKEVVEAYIDWQCEEKAKYNLLLSTRERIFERMERMAKMEKAMEKKMDTLESTTDEERRLIIRALRDFTLLMSANPKSVAEAIKDEGTFKSIACMTCNICVLIRKLAGSFGYDDMAEFLAFCDDATEGERVKGEGGAR